METKLKSYQLVPGEEIIDCNDLPLNSIGYTYPETIHSPSAGSHILTYGLRESYKVQIGLGANGYTLRSRVCQNNSWSGWETYTRNSDFSVCATIGTFREAKSYTTDDISKYKMLLFRITVSDVYDFKYFPLAALPSMQGGGWKHITSNGYVTFRFSSNTQFQIVYIGDDGFKNIVVFGL